MKTIAETNYGPVEGREKEGALLFAGIPYAAPPVGSLRFRAAQPHEAWNDVRDARRFGPAAPQIPSGGLTDSAPAKMSEDCLSLNIATPALDDVRRPVLVWIHGGGFRTGQGGVSWYNGLRFANNGGIVVVSINYRLGALGFADLSEFGSEYATSGINGILDQIVALEWIKDNIAAFGGDPDQVTIAGESAGGFSVSTLLGSPRAAGLFQRAIAQSGGAHYTLPPDVGKEVTQLYIKALGASGIDDLLSASVDEVLVAQKEIDAELERGPGGSRLRVPVPPFYPVFGNDVLPRSPLDAIRSGTSAGIPVLTGTNSDETTLWGYGEADEQRLVKTAGQYSGTKALLDAYRQERPEASTDELMIAMTTDHMFRIPAVRLAEARHDHGAETWMYLFRWKSRAFGGRLKATHALEIPFAFDNLDRSGVDTFLGQGPLPQDVADTMHRAWTAFIRDGDPGWETYAPESRATMCFDDVSTLVRDPDSKSRLAWEGLR
ncbi:MAG: carboxylesterase/lipase family protein [Proteobacteria bacterium]|nr:carboxylesterase/lipase family protein [Pseudomonadota bacterium]